MPFLCAAAFAAGNPPDVVYYNGKIITVSAAAPVVEAVSIRGNHFVQVGSSKDVLSTAGPSTKKIDLKGRCVLPGMFENHAHPVMAALAEIDGRLPSMRSIGDIQAFVRKEAARLAADKTIFVPKVYPSRLKERRYPNRYDLDAAAPGRLVMCDNHYASVFSSALLAKAGITRDTAQPSVGKIIKDERGEPTGLIIGAPEYLVKYRQNRSYTHDELLWAIREMHKEYNKAGITSVSDRMEGPEGFRAYQELWKKGQLTVRTSLTYYIKAQGTPADVAAEVRSVPFVTGWGDEWMRVGPIKTTVDGGILIGTAYMREPWGPNTQIYGFVDPDYRGVVSIKKENLFEMVRVANELGWQVTAHAAGGGAVDLMLDAYEAADKIKPISGRRFNLMHANFMNARAIERAKKLGLIVDSQIAWYHCDADALHNVFGPERMAQFVPLRSLMDAGLVVVGGADHMIKFDSREAANPYNPFYGIWMSVTRKTTGGAVFNPEQCVKREEALRMWTINGAYDMFEENIKGSIEPGKLADMIVIDRDLLKCPVDDIKDINVLMTMVDGKIVYGTL
ncbi:MAG: amidohydrolase [Bryobacteraceae bacterium]